MAVLHGLRHRAYRACERLQIHRRQRLVQAGRAQAARPATGGWIVEPQRIGYELCAAFSRARAVSGGDEQARIWDRHERGQAAPGELEPAPARLLELHEMAEPPVGARSELADREPERAAGGS